MRVSAFILTQGVGHVNKLLDKKAKKHYNDGKRKGECVSMEKYAWKARVLEGKLDEYRRRHDEIWPEMVALLKEAGISNYTIWNVGDELFGYYECEKGVDYAAAVQAKSPIVERWNEYMKDVMEMERDPETGAQPRLVKVFELL